MNMASMEPPDVLELTVQRPEEDRDTEASEAAGSASRTVCGEDESSAGSHAEWIPDSSVTSCQQCDKVFGVWTRRHHCRGCGGVYCNACTRSRRGVDGYITRQRVCDKCANQLLQQDRQQQYFADAAVASALAAAVAAQHCMEQEAPAPLHWQQQDLASQHSASTTPPLTPCPLPEADRPHRCGGCLNTQCGEYKVKVVVHGIRNVGVHALQRPRTSVIVSTEIESDRTAGGDTGCNTSFEEEFVLRVSGCTSDVSFTLLDDGMLVEKPLGRACVPLATLGYVGEVRRAWLELLPCDPTNRIVTFRSGTRAGAMRRPKRALGYICVTVLTSFNNNNYRRFLSLFCDRRGNDRGPDAWSLIRSHDSDDSSSESDCDSDSSTEDKPERPPMQKAGSQNLDEPGNDFRSREFLMHVNRMRAAWRERCPSLLLAVRSAPPGAKAFLILPVFAAMICSTTLATVPFFLFGLLVLNAATRTPLQDDIPVFDVNDPASMATKVRRAYHTVHELPVVLRKIQRYLDAGASFYEKLSVLASFAHPMLSLIGGGLLLCFCCILALLLALLPFRLLVFLVGMRVILSDGKKSSPTSQRMFAVPRRCWKRMKKLLRNFYAHIPDSLEVEHRIIAVSRRSNLEPPPLHRRGANGKGDDLKGSFRNDTKSSFRNLSPVPRPQRSVSQVLRRERA